MARQKGATQAQADPTREAAPRQPKAKPAKSSYVLSGVPRVNLMPTSELERRATVSLVRRWLLGLLATAAVISAVVAGTNWMRAAATAELIAEQDRTVSLNSELASYATVSQTLAEQAELTAYRTAAMGNDIEWRSFFKTLVAAVPDGSAIQSF